MKVAVRVTLSSVLGYFLGRPLRLPVCLPLLLLEVYSSGDPTSGVLDLVELFGEFEDLVASGK